MMGVDLDHFVLRKGTWEEIPTETELYRNRIYFAHVRQIPTEDLKELLELPQFALEDPRFMDYRWDGPDRMEWFDFAVTARSVIEWYIDHPEALAENGWESTPILELARELEKKGLPLKECWIFLHFSC